MSQNSDSGNACNCESRGDGKVFVAGVDQGAYWGQTNIPFFVNDFAPWNLTPEESAGMYRKWREYRYNMDPEALTLVNEIARGAGRVLEVGVGAGMDFCEIARLCAEAYGIDLSHENVARTKAAMQVFDVKGNVRQGNAMDLPFEENFFDSVYSYGVLHHTGDTQKAIDECIRVLKPGGRLGLMLYHTWFPTLALRFVHLLVGTPVYDPRMICQTYTRAQAVRMLRGNVIRRIWYETPRNVNPGFLEKVFWSFLDSAPFLRRIISGSFMMLVAVKR